MGDIARDKFRLGQRVRMTEEALQRRLDGPIVKRSKGVVKAFPKTTRTGVLDPRTLVSILRDGEKHPRQYAAIFWEPDE